MNFSKRVKCILVVAIAVAMMFSLVSVTAFASPLSDYQKQQQELEDKMDNQLDIIKKQKSEKEEIQTQVETLDAKINRLTADMEAANVQLQVAQDQINKATTELAAAEKRLGVRNEALASRVRELYVTGDVSLMDVFFEANSYNDFLVRYDMMEKIMNRDVNLLDQIRADKASIEENKALLEERAHDLTELKSSKEDSKASLETIQDEKSTMLKEAQSDLDQSQAYYDEMEKTSNQIASQIRSAQNSSSSSSGSVTVVPSGGSFSWPIPGHSRVSADYGQRGGMWSSGFHTGVDFPAPSGTKVVSADSGRVISARYMGGYGNCVIIDHGGGLSTVYAHLSSTAVSNGQSVSAGQKIGGVGTTGNSSGNHLHFEVRVNGDHVNPWGYI